ncbi:MAG: SCO family protein [Candidatus Marinimicrobia bacterium]|nr:SCO family protein [Candidatus Neomarinimicrobiota bacterium]
MNRKLNIISRPLFLFALLLQLGISTSYAQLNMKDDPALRDIDVVENLGGKLPLELTFTDENGNVVALAEFFDGRRPVVLALAYYECPMLCTLVLNGIVDGVRSMDKLSPGEDYRLLTVSIDPEETAELASNKQKTYVSETQKEMSAEDWHFLVGAEANIRALADSLGFNYYYDEERDEYAHPAVIYLLTPEGEISRYLYGIQFKEQDLRLGLLEASRGNIGSTLERVLLYCYHYDPDANGYTVLAGNVMQLGGVVTLGLLSLFLGVMWIRDRRRKSQFDES